MISPRPPTDDASHLRQGATVLSPSVAGASATRPAVGLMPLSKRRLMEALLVVVLGCLASVSGLAYRALDTQATSERWEMHTRVVIESLGALFSSIKDAETGQRGFIITGQPEYLEPYHARFDAALTHLADLRRLTADNPQQQQRLAVLAPLVAAKFSTLQQTIALRETQGFAAASAVVMAGSGKNLMDQIRMLVAEAQEVEAQLLQERIATRQTDTRKTIRWVVLGGALGSFALLLLFTYLRWELASRRRAQAAEHASEERYRSLFNSIEEGFCIIEMVFDADNKPDDYRFLEVNPAFQKQSGIQAVRGKRMRQLVPDTEEHWFEIYGNVSLTGQSHRFVSEAKALDGRWFDVYAFRLKEPERACVAVLFTDITERRQARNEILRLNGELEERVHQRTAQLEAANKELEAFSYSVSHDLRSPLNTIDGFSQLLTQAVGDKTDTKAKHYLGRIRAGIRQMSELVDGFLTLASLSQDKLQFTVVDLTALAGRIGQALQERNPERQAQLCIQDGMLAHADPRLLSIVIQNLLGNAWKFTARRELACIEIGSLPDQAGTTDETVYFVKDNGVGFEMTHAKQIFGVFERLHADADFSGTGIGLASVKRVIDRHNGRAWAESRENEGATFYFTLPRNAEANAAP